MAEVEVAIGKSKYKIGCPDSEKEKLIETASRLNERVNRLSFSFRNTDEKTLLVLSALTIEEELHNAGGIKSPGKNPEKNPEKNNDESSQISDQDIFDAVSENMENMSGYLEKLTKKIRNY